MTRIKKENTGKIKDKLPKKSMKSKREMVGKIKSQPFKKTVKVEKNGIKKPAKPTKKNIEKLTVVKKENVENMKPKLKDEKAKSVEVNESTVKEEKVISKAPRNEGVQIHKSNAREAISNLKKLAEHFSSSKEKKPLLDDSADNHVFLQVTLHKIPLKHYKKILRIKLPHSLLTDNSEVCLITGDLDKNDKKGEIDPTVLHYKELLRKHNIKGITQVVPLRQLRTEYKTFESKRQLSAAYDVFLNDQKITGPLPKLLGKAFYRRRKFPIQINMNSTNLKQQVEKALSEIVFPFSCLGNSYASEVARLSMDDDEILENILECVESIIKNVPGHAKNIQGLYIKTAKSEAIPIFMSYNIDGVPKLPKGNRRQKGVKALELSTLPGHQIKVYRDGSTRVVKAADGSDDSDVESSAKPDVETEEKVLPKNVLMKKVEKRSKSKRQNVKKEDSSDKEDISHKESSDMSTIKVLPKKVEKRNESKKQKVKQEDSSDEEDISDKESSEGSEVKTRVVAPKALKRKVGTKNKSKKRKVEREVSSAEDDSD